MQLLVYIFNFQINESPIKKRMHNKNAFEIKEKRKIPSMKYLSKTLQKVQYYLVITFSLIFSSFCSFAS